MDCKEPVALGAGPGVLGHFPYLGKVELILLLSFLFLQELSDPLVSFL